MLDAEENVHLIDFGLSHSFLDEHGKHQVENHVKGFKGTWGFCSLRTAQRLMQTRRDDLESLLYLICYMIRINLPWIPEHSKMTHAKKKAFIVHHKKQGTYASVIKLLP